MSQLYRFTDENGQVRLFAEIDPSPAGTPFNGGTITPTTDPGLQISVPNTVTDALTVYDSTDASTTFGIDPFGNISAGQVNAAPVQGVNALVVNGFDATHYVATFAPSAGANRILFSPSGYLLVKATAAPADAEVLTNYSSLWFDPTNGSAKLMLKAKQADGTVVAPGLTGRDLATAPAVSAASTLALGTAYQNTLGYDVLLCVYLSVTVNTSGVLKLGVGPTTTPTQQTLVTGITSTGLWPVPIYLPNTYYALLSVTGTITVAVDGQIAMPV